MLGVLYKRTNIRRRNSVLRKETFVREESENGPTTRERMERYAREVLPLTLAAARRALVAAETAASEMTHLITVSCTGFVAPGVDIALMREMNLKQTANRTHIGFMGCHGALNGLRLASAFVDAQPSARVLLCAVELCSLHFYYGWDPEKVVANGLFADGAAALVGSSSRSNHGKFWKVQANGARIFPDSEGAMTWQIGDHGFEMALSPELPQLISTHLRSWLEPWLGEQGFRLDEIPSWAIHPGGPRILQAVQECLDLPEEATLASREILAEYGNMSSPTVLFILERLQKNRSALPCVALGFGPGLAAEAALILG